MVQRPRPDLRGVPSNGDPYRDRQAPDPVAERASGCLLQKVRAAPHDASGLTTLQRPHSLTEFLSGLEEGDLLAGNLDGVAGLGIAPLSGIAAPGPKTAETSQLHFVPLPQSLGNAREQNADDGFGLSLGKVDSVGNSFSEFCFCHVSSPNEGTRSAWTRPPTKCDDRGAPASRGGECHWPETARRSLSVCRPVISSFSAPSHSFNFDHRRRPDTLRTAMATAFFCPTSTTSRLPRVTPV